MSDEPRVLRPDRRQIHFDVVDLESQLPEDPRGRIVSNNVGDSAGLHPSTETR